MSLVWVATSEAQTCPIWISKDIISSYSGGNARQKETKLGRVGMKKAYRLACVKTVGKKLNNFLLYRYIFNIHGPIKYTKHMRLLSFLRYVSSLLSGSLQSNSHYPTYKLLFSSTVKSIFHVLFNLVLTVL